YYLRPGESVPKPGFMVSCRALLREYPEDMFFGKSIVLSQVARLTPNDLIDCILIANGELQQSRHSIVPPFIERTFVFSDGDVALSSAKHSVIISTGSIRIGNEPRQKDNVVVRER